MTHFLMPFLQITLLWKILLIFLVLWDQKQECLSLTRSTILGSSSNNKWTSFVQQDNQALGSCCNPVEPPHSQAKSAYMNNCPKCWMRPLAASLCSAKWMYFTPFEQRKVWSFSDVNWVPLSLSSASGIPHPVNSLLVLTGMRILHNSQG